MTETDKLPDECALCGDTKSHNIHKQHNFMAPTQANKLRMWARTFMIEGKNQKLMLAGADALDKVALAEDEDDGCCKECPLCEGAGRVCIT